MYEEFQEFWNKKWKNVWMIHNNPFSSKVEIYCKNTWLHLIDIWSWNGRDSMYFAKKWFQVTSFDFSQVALENFKEYLSQNDIFINTIIWNTLDYDFKKEHYDIVYACNSLHYFSKENTRKVFQKLKESLKKWWYFFVRVKSIHDVDFGKWEKIEENFYKNGDDLKYYFDIDFMKELFADFEILEWEELQDVHNILKWYTKQCGFIDLVAKKK